MKTQIPPEWMKLELEHKYYADGWGIVEVLDDEYVRVTWPKGCKQNANRAFLAWAKLLKPAMRRQNPKDPKSPLVEQPFDADEMAILEEARAAIASGRKKVVDTYIVKA